jgi:hypothetical protein
MCSQCIEIDKRIEHYRTMAARVTDQRTLDGIGLLIERLETQKKALHPEE